jgi:hypothetical protein
MVASTVFGVGAAMATYMLPRYVTMSLRPVAFHASMVEHLRRGGFEFRIDHNINYAQNAVRLKLAQRCVYGNCGEDARLGLYRYR